MASKVCAGVDCGAEGKMRCPTCVKLGLTNGSYFCNQACFKRNWATHKLVHKSAKAAKQPDISEVQLSYPGFQFTGPLRPFKQSPTRIVPAHIPRPDYADDRGGVPHGEMRRKSVMRQLNAEEIQKMRVACKLGREVLDACGAIIKPGITTDEIDRVCHEACVERNSYPSPLNYFNFPKSCCTSVNEVICHGIPDGYILKNGDIVNVDISLFYDGVHADLNETFLVGKVDDESVRLVKTTYDCLMKAIEQCKPGMRYRDIGNIISKHAHSEKFSVVRSYCGHGINDLFHCAPNVPHYQKNKAVGFLKPGHTFTIEPMINMGHWQDVTWPDNWTSTTTDGKRSAQFEHTLLVTETGVEILTARTKDSPSGPMWFETVLAEKEKAGQAAPAAEGAAQ
eukprot:m.18513 g.18513  ORF g.18513 m.18513 type:complete len:395 (-) comp7892_c0_seq1:2267-3451(-)